MSHTRISAKNHTKPLLITLIIPPSSINIHNCPIPLQNNFGKYQKYRKLIKILGKHGNEYHLYV